MKNKITMPDYNHCILNTITSIMKYYHVETEHQSLQTLDKVLKKKYKNVIFLILDGMGEHILKKASPKGYFSSKEVDCVTSVYPSTTTAALTTYYSGKPPYETGWIAWSQYFKEYGRAIDMLSHKESYQGDSLKDAKINVFDSIVNYETIFSKIEKASKIKAYEIMPSYSDRRSVQTIKADNLNEMIENMEMLCKIPEEKFIMAYSDNPDSILHKYGTSSKEAKDFIETAERKIEELVKKLEDTVIIITADHGHKDIEKAYDLLDYPEIQECLIMPPSLEARSITFWVKEDKKDEFVKRFNAIFANSFLLLTKEEFLEKHFLGYGKKHPKIDDFIGNYVALSIKSDIIRLETFLAEGKPLKKSTHCGLSKEEMEVPIIIIEK